MTTQNNSHLNFQPFHAWRYNTDIVDVTAVLAPPYDVISEEKQQKLYERSLYNSIRLILNKKEETDSDTQNAYTRARDAFAAWQKENILIQEKTPSFYLYRQTFKDPSTGELKNRSAILGRVKLEPFEKGIIVPHEKTLSGPKADRMKLLKTVKINLSPVFGLFQDSDLSVGKIIQSQDAGEKLFEVEDDDGVFHAMFVIKKPAVVENLQKTLETKKVYIADGHHRYETALEYSRLRREELKATPNEKFSFDYMYMALVRFNDPGFIVLPTHRVLLNTGLVDSEILKRLEEYFSVEAVTVGEIEKLVAAKPNEELSFGLSLKNGNYILKLKNKEAAKKKIAQEKPEVWFDLNVNILGHLIFAKILDLPETKWESAVRFDHTVDGAIKLMKNQNAQAVFFLQAPEIGMLEKMGAVNERMPQKSTYFYPKLATGLIFHAHKE